MEKSKTYQRLGRIVGIEAVSKKQRGIIARKAAKRLEELEYQEFSQSLKRITFSGPIKHRTSEGVRFV